MFVKVTRADYLAGRTALHFAAVNGHARCIRLVLADFVPSEQLNPLPESGVVVTPRNKSGQRFSFFPSLWKPSSKGFDLRVSTTFLCSALSKFVNKAADGGITALHMAALNGLFDCVQLLLDLEANVSAVTFHYGTSMDMIGISISLSTTPPILPKHYF